MVWETPRLLKVGFIDDRWYIGESAYSGTNVREEVGISTERLENPGNYDFEACKALIL